MVTYRLRMVETSPGIAGTPPPPDAGTPLPPAETAEIRVGGQTLTAAFLDRATCPQGLRIAGPAVIEEPSATTFLPPGWQAEVLATGDLMLTRGTTA